ncbi:MULTISPECIES: hypothetical protein [unclassified Comamonas]|uniref:hypothetical protein n=2 Tax=Comamonas TaxID=283 RepID=UPI0003F7F5A4|nr:hypothetical protein [Comamonas sp. B-9]
MKLLMKMSALVSVLALAGCAAPPPEPAPAPAPAVPVQVECGVASPPGCREPAVPPALLTWEQKMKGEIDEAEALRLRAVEAMSALPAKQRIKEGSKTMTTEQVFSTSQAPATRAMPVLDSVSLDLPWAAKSRQEHKDAMVAIKDIATMMADNRGGATIYVTVSPRDLRAKKVNTNSGTAPTEAGNPVEVKKSADKNVPAGVEHFVIQAKPWPSRID